MPINLERFNNHAFDRGAPRWKEALWWLARALFFLHPLPVPSSLKVACLRAFGASIGSGVVIRSFVNVSFPWRLTIGDHVWLGDEVTILSLAEVTIGNSTCLSQRAFLCTGSHDFNSSDFALVTKPISIGQSSWVAAGAFVGPGVSVGSGALVGAAAVVVRNVPDHHFARGNPASISLIETDPSTAQ